MANVQNSDPWYHKEEFFTVRTEIENYAAMNSRINRNKPPPKRSFLGMSEKFLIVIGALGLALIVLDGALYKQAGIRLF